MTDATRRLHPGVGFSCVVICLTRGHGVHATLTVRYQPNPALPPVFDNSRMSL